MTNGECDIQWARFYGWSYFGIKLYISSFVVNRFLWIFCLYYMVAILKTVDLSKFVFVWASWPVQHSNTDSTSVWIWDGTFCLADQWKTWGMSRKLGWKSLFYVFMHACSCMWWQYWHRNDTLQLYVYWEQWHALWMQTKNYTMQNPFYWLLIALKSSKKHLNLWLCVGTSNLQ